MTLYTDICEEALVDRDPRLLELLLTDRATGGHLIWATDHYVHLGRDFAPQAEITSTLITGPNRSLIQPRVEKTKTHRWDRTKDRAEVFTPPWLCNEQNNRIDHAWFGRSDVFNSTKARTWDAQLGKVRFDPQGPRTWKQYVDERRLEVACGEAPYLVSRYDTTTGEPIELFRRIGLLDRKLRVVSENVASEEEWRTWARRAFESVYGFEYQGDNLLLARQNLFATYLDYANADLGLAPSTQELLDVATIISWNLWQMDAFTGLPPLQAASSEAKQLDLFGAAQEVKHHPCVVRDWRTEQVHAFAALGHREVGSA